MSEYHAPTRDMAFVIRELADFEALAELPGFQEATPELMTSILEEAARLGEGVLAPLNISGDQEGVHWHQDGVTAAAGFADAYAQYAEAGWNGLTGDPEYSGMGLPEVLGAATHEVWNSANLSFGLAPMLTSGAIELLSAFGSDEQKRRYMEKLNTGEWTGTMDLTEPQAGTDLGSVRTRAEPAEDGSYRLFGQKIFITWGEHDMADNIVHLVLARLPDAPAGVKGISLFIVPKYLVNDDDSLGARNDMRCAAVEDKMGIHASPTCAMAYGDEDGAVGYMVGEPNQGLRYMFKMMNSERHKVGIQGMAVAERAYQRAVAYARERVQGKPLNPDAPDGAPITHHPDVRRMLLDMRARTEAMRALCYIAGAAMDRAAHDPDEQTRDAEQARVDLLVPVVKGWCTELGQTVASIGVQVHGGMGFIEETGAAQYQRDVRITAIYEGTNGIQAQDLVGRKLLSDEGRAMNALIADMRATCQQLETAGGDGVKRLHEPVTEAVDALERATQKVLEIGGESAEQAMAVSYDYMMLAGYSIGGWLSARAALAAQSALEAGMEPADFYRGKLETARFYADHVLPAGLGHARVVANAGNAVTDVAPASL